MQCPCCLLSASDPIRLTVDGTHSDEVPSATIDQLPATARRGVPSASTPMQHTPIQSVVKRQFVCDKCTSDRSVVGHLHPIPWV